jgi:tRNA(Ile)-lysidine synthase
MNPAFHAGLAACARRLDPGSTSPLAVAFSGGGDSLALLLVARAFASSTGRPLVALHVDHGLQPQSAAWGRQAQAQAERLGARFRLLRWDGPKPVAGLPAAARDARHRLIAEAARAAGCAVVLIGHTLDDQIENALMRDAGVPIGPLCDWSPSPVWPQGRGLFLARPLLGQRRAALRAWLAAEGLDWIEDPANDDERRPRTAARREAQAGQGAPLAPAAHVADLAPACRVTPWGGFEIDRARLTAAPPDAALRLLQIAVACASGGEGLARPGRARSLLARLKAGERFAAVLAGTRVEAAEGLLRLHREAGEARRGGLEPLILAPGQTGVWDGRFEAFTQGAGMQVRALRGLAARLPRDQAAALKAIPASARPSLPILCTAQEDLIRVRLALGVEHDHIDKAGVFVRALAPVRFAAAAGLVMKEDEIGTIAGLAMAPPAS